MLADGSPGQYEWIPIGPLDTLVLGCVSVPTA